jgi:signal transduction histidine kinase
LFITALAALIRWRASKLEREKQRLEITVAERTQDLRIKTDQLEKINLIVKTINSEIELVSLLNALLSQLKTIKGVERMAALAWDEIHQTYRFIAADGWELKRLQSIQLSATEAEQRYVRHSKEINQDIFIIKDMASLELNEKFSHIDLPKSALIMRIRIHNTILAYFIFDNMSRPHAFEDHDIDLLFQLREHITLAFMKVKLMDELKRLNEKKNEFLGIAAHDLRSPLNVIVGFVSLIIEEMRSNAFDLTTGLTDLEDVLKAAKNMTHLLSELLDISAIESGKVVLNKTPLNFSSVFDECARNHAKIAAQKNIVLTFESSNELPPVQADRVRIMEVLDNLISNAVKFTFPGGSVRVTAQSQDDHITVSVGDTGQGLDGEDLKVIFNSFKKLSARPTAGETSTGLGLAIVKKIIEMHGGQVTVESVKGQGSTFQFTLNA